MDFSLLLAQVIGIYLILEGIVVLARRKFVISIVNDLDKNRALMFVTGAMLVVLGLLIVLNHNIWEATWRVVPTIVGWGMVVKGVLILFIPGIVLDMARAFGRKRNAAILAGVVALAVGVYLVYVGFGLGM